MQVRTGSHASLGDSPQVQNTLFRQNRTRTFGDTEGSRAKNLWRLKRSAVKIFPSLAVGPPSCSSRTHQKSSRQNCGPSLACFLAYLSPSHSLYCSVPMGRTPLTLQFTSCRRTHPSCRLTKHVPVRSSCVPGWSGALWLAPGVPLKDP